MLVLPFFFLLVLHWYDVSQKSVITKRGNSVKNLCAEWASRIGSECAKPLLALMFARVRRAPNAILYEVGNLTFIRESDSIEQCRRVLVKIEADSPELFNVLANNQRMEFWIAPEVKKSIFSDERIMVGHDYTKWGERGLTAFFVWRAYMAKDRVSLRKHRTDDYDAGGYKFAGACISTSRWLSEHGQSALLVQFYLDMAKSAVAKRATL